MKISLHINFHQGGLHIFPSNYRVNIVSLIKECLYLADKEYFDNLYTHKKIKPFTFNLLIPGAKSIKDEYGFSKIHFYGRYIKLFISSYEDEFIEKFLAGLKMLNGNYTPFKFPVFYSDVIIEKIPEILTEEKQFHLISPLIVRYDGRYLTPESNNYIQALSFNIQTLVKEFLDLKFNFKIEIKRSKEIKVNCYEIMPAITGDLHMKSDKELLNLLLCTGIGGRRSQGFGMVI